MKKKMQTLQIFFKIIVAIDIIGIFTNIPLLHYAAKPLLIPALIMLLMASTRAVAGKKLMLIALFFSWAGDVLLMFESRHALFFITGLVCFLTTHVFYIIYFLSIRSDKVSLLKKYPFLIILVIAYGISLVWLLFPHLGDLVIPVMVYAAVICSMLLCSLHIFYKVNKKSGSLYIAGALFFVLSDSLLAFNKFYKPFNNAGVFIILTYCAAQYLIVKGFIEQKSAANDK